MRVFGATVSALLIILLAAGLLAPLTLSAAATDQQASALPPLGQNLELVGQVGGTIRAVAVQGTLAYVGIGPRLVALDVTAPDKPRSIGKSAPLHGVVSDVAISGGYAYVVTQNASLHILDITDPTHPWEAGAVPVGGDAQRIAVAGGMAYVAAADAGLRLFDVRDPVLPTPSGTFATPAPASDVAVRAQYAYVAAGSAVRVVDLSQPAGPVEAGSLTLTGSATHVALRDQWLYVMDSGHALPENRSTGDARLVIFDASDPARPVRTGEHRTGGGVAGLAVADGFAYVAVSWWNDAGLRIIDVSNPADPVRAGNFPIRWNEPLDIAVSGGVVFVVEASGTLRTIAVSGPGAPVETGRFTVAAQIIDVDVHRGHAFAWDYTSGLHIYSLADQANLRETGVFVPRGGVPDLAAEIAVAGDYAYVPGGDGLYVVDIRDPAHPTEAGFLAGVSSQGLAVADGYLYVGRNDLSVWSLADPAQPVEVGRFSPDSGPPLSVLSIVIRGQYAYLAGFWSGLTVVSVADPARPVGVGYYRFSASKLAISGDYVYGVDFGYRNLLTYLRVISVADLGRPIEVAVYESPGRANGVAVADGTAYVSTGEAGIRAVSLADPVRPTETGHFDTPGGATGVTAADGLVYAYGGGGLMVLRPTASVPAPVLTSPAHGSTLTEIAAELAWQNPPGTAQVEVRVLPYANDGPGLDMIYGSPRESLRIDAPVMGQGPYLLLPDMGYTWTVRSSTATQPLGVDSPEWGPWSPPQTFRTPPVNAAGITPVVPEPGATGVRRTPTVQWRDARADVFYYEVQVSRDPRFETHPVRGTTPVYWNLVHGGVTTPLNSWAVPASAALEPGMTYYWRVRPRVQGDGMPVAWSPAWSFSVE